MIELLCLGNFLPALAGVARFAGLRECPVMRVGMAVRAFRERHAREPRRASRRRGRVAFRARHLLVQSRERESCLVVIDFRRRFPVHEIVALDAILAELPLVRIIVTGHAIRRQPEVRLPQILHLDRGLHGSLNVRGRVTLIALDHGVLSLQTVACLAMIECLQRRLPVNEREILAVVLGMAFRAVLLVCKMRMQPVPARNFGCNFDMAFLAL